MKQTLETLYAGERLSTEDAHRALSDVADGAVSLSQTAAFLSALRMRALSAQELQGFRAAMLERALIITLPGDDFMDVCGTGGDGKKTINISTLSALVLAGAGVRVAKHGNYGASSMCGSSTVLEQLGIRLTNDISSLTRQFERTGICFLHAPLFHPAMKRIAPLRKELQVKTFFNMLGPLLNPAQPKYQLSGVYDHSVGLLYQEILPHTHTRFMVVHSDDGHDEVSLTSHVHVYDGVGIKRYSPEDFGFSRVDASILNPGESVAEAVKIFQTILRNEAPTPCDNVIIANAGLALSCVQPKLTLAECFAKARESLESKRALGVLTQLLTLQ